jgi:hypothetical protein
MQWCDKPSIGLLEQRKGFCAIWIRLIELDAVMDQRIGVEMLVNLSDWHCANRESKAEKICRFGNGFPQSWLLGGAPGRMLRILEILRLTYRENFGMRLVAVGESAVTHNAVYSRAVVFSVRHRCRLTLSVQSDLFRLDFGAMIAKIACEVTWASQRTLYF